MNESFPIRHRITDDGQIHHFVDKVPIKKEYKTSLIFSLTIVPIKEELKKSLIFGNAKVPIKEELKKSLIFGLEARLPIGIILGYVGYRPIVIDLM